MARRFRRFHGGGGSKNNATRALNQLVTLIILLYVFDQLLKVVVPLVNSSTFFATAVSLTQTLLPIVGLIAAYKIIKRQLESNT